MKHAQGWSAVITAALLMVATAILVHEWALVAAPECAMRNGRLWASSGAYPATSSMPQFFGETLSVREGYTGMATARLSLVILRREIGGCPMWTINKKP